MLSRNNCQHFLIINKTKKIFSQAGIGGVLMGGTLVVICLQSDTSSVVLHGCHRVFQPFITIHPRLMLAHHRLIRPGCVSQYRLHEQPTLSVPALVAANGCFL